MEEGKGKELERELESIASKEKEEKWVMDEMIYWLREHAKEYPRQIVELPFLEEELRKWGVRLIIRNVRDSIYTVVVAENNVVKVLAKTEEEFLRLIMDMIAERLKIARTW